MQLLQKDEEKLLFSEIAGGSEAAFKKIYDCYFNHLTAYVFKISKSEAITEEVVQDVFMKLWLNRESLNGIEIPQSYIFSITRNKTIDYLRKLVKETNLMATVGTQIAQSTNEIEDKIGASELQMLIAQSLSQLSAQKQQIFKLSRYEDYSHDDIAKQLNLSKSTVKNHLSETLQYLRRRLATTPNSEHLLLVLLLNLLKN